MSIASRHPVDCPNWEYKDFPNHSDIVGHASTRILVRLRSGTLNTAECACNTRRAHKALFQNLTPLGHQYFAGHYRGEDFRCLKYYEVEIQGDTRVGTEPQYVGSCMRETRKIIKSTLTSLDSGHTLPNRFVSRADKVLYTVCAACRIFELVLRIHPYANGNGHMARFVIWAILGRYGYWPIRWPLEPRPQDPPYTDLIVQYRNGNKQPLELYVLKCIIQDE